VLFVVLAEMGDKTQLLGMAFATRYRWDTVMWGVFIATVLNHLFAVIVGNYITQFVPLNYVQLVAAASFILFGLWTIRGDQLEGEDRERSMSPFWTVTVAFFMAEMGDKTQLATIALAAKYHQIVPVWLGTTAGMMVANAIGILVGVVLGKQIPERLVKWVSAVIFIAFGLIGLYDAAPKEWITLPVVIATLAVVAILMYIVATWSDEGTKPLEELK
jgi:putative Ca2+/H+ antiporter (TMEM165/GDT1 family)